MYESLMLSIEIMEVFLCYMCMFTIAGVCQDG